MHALNNYVIIEAIGEDEKKSVIITNDTPKKSKGLVISVGKECKEVTQGDTILIPRYTDECMIENKTYLVCKEEDICVIFKY